MPITRSSMLIALPLAVGFAGCLSGRGLPAELDVETSINDDVSTLIELAWTTAEPGISWVDYGNTPSYEHSTPREEVASTEHQFTLMGLTALSDVYYRVNSMIDGDTLTVEGQTATGALPSWLPEFDLVANDPEDRSPEPYMMGVVMGVENALFIMDRAGRWLWYQKTREFMSDDLPIYAEFSFAPGDNTLQYLTYNFNFDLEQGGLWSTKLADGAPTRIVLPDAHHDYCQLPDGGFAYLAGDVRPWYDGVSGETVDVVGDRIVEVSPDGSMHDVFSTWDWVDPVRSADWNSFLHPAGEDWTHGNSLHYNENRDSFQLSLGRLDTVVEVDRGSGRPLHAFGREGDIPVVEGRPFEFQHDAQWTDDGTLLMTSNGDEGNASYVAEYALTANGLGLREVWSNGEDLGLTDVAEGRVTRLANGNTLMSFGSGGVVREVTPNQEVVWQIETYVGNAFLSATLFSDFYIGE